MQAVKVSSLCALYGLGEPRHEPALMNCGELHSIWKLVTTRGSYAVKQLHTAIARSIEAQNVYRRAEHIALTMQAAGIPTRVALRGENNDTVQSLNSDVFLLYEWIEERTPGVEARHIGQLLARIHALNYSSSEFAPPDWAICSDEEWDMLTFQAAEKEARWVQRVRNALPRLIEWSHAFMEAGKSLKNGYLLSHRALSRDTIVWQSPEHPIVLNWESAGWVHPTMELAETALSWSGKNSANEERFTAILESYIACGGSIQVSGDVAMQGIVGSWLAWLLFEIRRSLGEAVDSEQERQLAEQRTIEILDRLFSFTAQVATYSVWLDRYR